MKHKLIVENNRILKIDLPMKLDEIINEKRKLARTQQLPNDTMETRPTTATQLNMTSTSRPPTPTTTTVKLHRNIYIRGHLVGEVSGRRNPNQSYKGILGG